MSKTEIHPTRLAIQNAMILRGYNGYNEAQWRVITAEVKLARVMPHQAREAMATLMADATRRPKPIEVVNLLKRRPWDTPAAEADDCGPGPFSGDVYAEFKKLPKGLQHDLLKEAGSDRNLRERAERDADRFSPSTAGDPVGWMLKGMREYPWMQKVAAAFLYSELRENGTLTDELVEAYREEEKVEVLGGTIPGQYVHKAPEREWV